MYNLKKKQVSRKLEYVPRVLPAHAMASLNAQLYRRNQGVNSDVDDWDVGCKQHKEAATRYMLPGLWNPPDPPGKVKKCRPAVTTASAPITHVKGKVMRGKAFKVNFGALQNGRRRSSHADCKPAPVPFEGIADETSEQSAVELVEESAKDNKDVTMESEYESTKVS